MVCIFTHLNVLREGTFIIGGGGGGGLEPERGGSSIKFAS